MLAQSNRLLVDHTPPRFGAADAIRDALELFGVRATASPLPSERDQNFLLTSASGERFVLKYSHAEEEAALLECQADAAEHIRRSTAAVAVQGILPTVGGDRIARIPGSDGASHFARLMTWLDGVPLAAVRPHSADVLHGVGSLLGRLDRALAAFDRPAAHRALKWDLRQGPTIVHDQLHHVAAADRRALVEKTLARFQTIASPLLPALRTAVIHGDANDHNILVAEAAEDPLAPREVAGILDFGDIVHSFVASELAIGAAYAMLGKRDPLAAAARVVRGYHEAFPLHEAEIEVLFPLIGLRLCTSVVLSAQQRKRRPDNAYLSVSEAGAWALLERLIAIPPSFAHYTFRNAAGLVPCVAGDSVSRWLSASAQSFAPVLGEAIPVTNAPVIDLTPESLELEGLDISDSAGAWTEAIFARMRASGARAAIGRYREPRRWYSDAAFRVDTDDGPEWRTIHVGIDLFAEPGTPVHAPLDGVVHAFADNAGRFDYGPTIVLAHGTDGEESSVHFYTLYGHLSRDSLRGLFAGMPVTRGQRIGSIGDAEVNGGWAPHLHVQVIADLLGTKAGFPGVARPSEAAVWSSISPDPSPLLGLFAERAAIRGTRDAADRIVERRQQHLGAALSISYRRPLHIVRGWQQHLVDADGRVYLDAVNNVAHVGHSHPRVVAALRRQAAVLNTNTRYLHENLVRYAERLAATLPEPLSVLYFVCSGSEANELALRMARAHTRRRSVVALEGGYHGNTATLIDVSPYKFDGPGGEGTPPHVWKAPLPDGYRGRHRGSDASVGARYAEHVRDALAAADHAGQPVAAFLVEPLPGCGGQVVPPEGYLTAAFRHAHEAGAVCIADEVQTGFGRVGSHFWAFEAQNASPDIVTMGKPIGNGHPIGAVATTPDIAASFANGMEYFNTFGGNPVSCAAGLAVLDVIEEERLQANASFAGGRLLGGLRELMNRHALIGDVRGAGLYIGVELVRDRAARTPAGRHAAWVAERMRDHGILLSTDGPDHNVLKIKPPLVFTADDADRLVATLDAVLSEDGARAGLS